MTNEMLERKARRHALIAFIGTLALVLAFSILTDLIGHMPLFSFLNSPTILVVDVVLVLLLTIGAYTTTLQDRE